jgi:hypothetical protein
MVHVDWAQPALEDLRDVSVGGKKGWPDACSKVSQAQNETRCRSARSKTPARACRNPSADEFDLQGSGHRAA